MKQFIKKCLRCWGYDIIRLSSDMTDEERAVVLTVSPFTLTGAERIVSLIRATEYIAANGIEGDFVECGVCEAGA